MSDSRNRVELMNAITVLYNWAVDPRDTISALSEKQAKQALGKMEELWRTIERRREVK